MVRRPPHFRRQVVARLAERFHRLREQQRLGDSDGLRLHALLAQLVPEGGEIRGDENAGDDIGVRRLERVDLSREIIREVLEAAGFRVDEVQDSTEKALAYNQAARERFKTSGPSVLNPSVILSEQGLDRMRNSARNIEQRRTLLVEFICIRA